VHRRIGSIALASKRPDAYCSEEVRFLALVADQAALAVDDALNFQNSQNARAELERKNGRLKQILELNNTIASNLELRDLLRSISASLRSIMQCDGVGVALPDGDGVNLRFYALDFPKSRGLIREENVVPVDGESPVAQSFRSGRPENVLPSDTDRIGPLAKGEGLQVLCHIPLISRKRTLGVVSLGRMAPTAFTQKDLDFLALLRTRWRSRWKTRLPTGRSPS
jgi:formate hydrogenlyase transcriptional activator